MAAGSKSSGNGVGMPLAHLISAARKKTGRSRAELGDPEFSAKYIAALEQGKVAPSRAALHLLAPRLDLAIERLLAAPQSLPQTAALTAIAEDVDYQGKLALLMTRSNRLDEALAQAATLEEYTRPYLDALPPAARYLVPFLRARVYHLRVEYAAALAQIELALQLAAPDEAVAVNIRNLLGLVYYDQERPDLALEQHLKCWPVVSEATYKDLNLRASVFRNLGNDFLVLGDAAQAIGFYKEALTALEDLNDPLRRAAIFWGLMMAYWTDKNQPQAIMFGLRALAIYEEQVQRDYAAIICLNLVEILFDGGRYDEGAQQLKKAKWFLHDSANPGALSFLNGDCAELALHEGRLAEAAAFAASSRSFAAANLLAAQNAGGSRIEHAAHVYAAALEISALVAEAQGNQGAADEFFTQGIDQISATAIDSIANKIRESYARVLKGRGAFESSTAYYQLLAQSRLRSRRGRSG